MFAPEQHVAETAVVNAMRRANPYLSAPSARYLAALVTSIALANPDKDPESDAIEVNEILLGRLRSGDGRAYTAAREFLEKYRPTYDAALEGGTDPVVALAMAFPLGGKIARQSVEMIEMVDAITANRSAV